jgi:hypothetical protein
VILLAVNSLSVLKPLRRVPTGAWMVAMPKGHRQQYFKRSTMRDLPCPRSHQAQIAALSWFDCGVGLFGLSLAFILDP